MIELSNGHCFEFAVPSGTLAFDGRGWPWEWPFRWFRLLDPHLFTIFVKTLLPEQWPGNFRWYRPFDVVKFINKEGETINPIIALTIPRLIHGVVNAIGLTGPGIDVWQKKYYPVITNNDYKVIVSITGPNGEEGCIQMVRRLTGLINIVGIEFNASCPNTDPVLLENPKTVIETCRAIKKETEHPLLLKLSCVQPYVEIAKELEGVVEAISINTVPWRKIFGDKPSPLEKYGGGGVSGPVTRYFSWKMISDLKNNTSIPIIGNCVWKEKDINRLFYGYEAQACSFGTISMPYPWKPTSYVRKYIRKNKAVR